MPREKKYENRINMFLSTEQLEAVKREADRIGVSVSAYLRICVVKSLRNRRGAWRHYEGYLICSECQAKFHEDIMGYCGNVEPKYCPDCGADMKGIEM